MKFKVGDIVTGNEIADRLYSYTNSKATMKVIGVTKYDIDVKIIAHEALKDFIGKVYTVYPKYFTLTSSVGKPNYIEIGEE